MNIYSSFGKRGFDFVVSSALLLLVSPVAVLLWVAVVLSMGSPAFFTQLRPGLKGITFEMMKFRTMTDQRDDDGNLLADEFRLTSFGKWLRSSSLDELPGLWNVIKGDMSLVGPRPLLVEYLPLYSREQARRHEVRPGITGWAQVNGRNTISWEEKFELDVWYVDHQSFWLDVRILWLTLIKVLKRDGISATGEATMSKFSGNRE